MSIQQLVQQYQAILQREQTAQQTGLENYRIALADLNQRYAQLQPVPPRPLTIPAIFGRSYGENFISDYLAYILDPAKNGIGVAPLAQFLELCDFDSTGLSLTEVKIYREYPVGSGRIDLLLEWEETLILGIENKILSAEGVGQTKYYAQELPHLFRDTACHFAYLTRGGYPADSKKFQPISYVELLDKLRNVPVAPSTGARQLILWYDFLEHLEVYIVMSDPDRIEFSDKAKLYIEHRAMIQDLENAFKNEWSTAIDYVEKQVRAHLGDGLWTTRFNRTFRQTWHQVLKPAWESSDLTVHYEYWLSIQSLTQQELTFMADVEGKQANNFLALFEQRYPALKAEYEQREIIYRPNHRKFAIAWKSYPIVQELHQVAEVFLDALDEFRFLEPEIDAVIAELTKQ
jgi:hypothetical protein